MDVQLPLVVYANGVIFDNLVVTPQFVQKYMKNNIATQVIPKETAAGDNLKTNLNYTPLRLNKKGLDAYLVSAYIHTLKRCNVYRYAAMKVLLSFAKSKVANDNIWVIFIKLNTPQKQFLDYNWNEKTSQMALERRELDHAMSWLSTLGGGFSALGEEFEYCAEMAGKISVRQLQLALRLGDPLLVARCKLYAALSLLQRGYLMVAKNMIEDIYRLAIAEKDVRLQKMCKGSWAKLQYNHKLKRQRKKSIRMMSC